MQVDETLTSGAVIGGDFVIERPIARGGMGSVYLARQRSTDRARALKIIRPELITEARQVERFMQEARIGAAIHSRHIVEVIAAGVDRELGAPWLVMELLEGETLAARVARTGALGSEEAAVLFTQIADAIGAAHDVGIIHRDLKPENLFLQSTPGEAQPWSLKVLDFGVSKVVHDNRTSATSTGQIGTPLWMAPEQCDAHGAIRAATDVWALGLLAFWVLTARCYWRGANVESITLSAILRELLIDPIEAPSARAKELGVAVVPAFDAWFLRCVDRDATARFANARAACTALVSLLTAPAHVTTPDAFAPTVALPVVESVRPAAIASAPPPPVPPPQPPAPIDASSNRGSRALWALVATFVIVGTIAAGIGINKRYEWDFEGDPPPRSRRAAVPVQAQTNQFVQPTVATQPAQSAPAFVPVAQQPPQQPAQPAAVAPARPMRSMHRAVMFDNACNTLTHGALSSGYSAEGAPSTAQSDARDAHAAGCRSAFELCNPAEHGDCGEYRDILNEGSSPWCCR